MPSRLFEGLTGDEALLRSEQLLSALRGVIWEADAVTGHFVFVSPHAEHVLGYPGAQWLLPGFWAAHLHQDDRDAAIAARRAAVAAGHDHELEYRMIAADGRVTWFRDLISVVVDPAGATRVRGLMVDVSEQKRAEGELRCLAQELSDAQRLARIANFAHDVDSGGVSFASHYGELLRPVLPASGTFEGFLNSLHPDDAPRVRGYLAHVFASDATTFEVDYRLQPGEGPPVHVNAVGRVQRAPDGRAMRVFGTVQNVTDQRVGEAAQAAHVRFLESLDLVNLAIQGASELEPMMASVLDAVLTVFDCDRVFLARRVQADPPRWQLAAQLVRDGFTGFERGHQFDAAVDAEFQAAVAAGALMRYAAEDVRRAPAHVTARLQVRSKIVAPIVLTNHAPFALGLHHCRTERHWTSSEERLLQEIGRRLADALAVVLTREAQHASEHRLAEAQRITHLGYWEIDYSSGHFTVSEETLRILAAPVTGTVFPLEQSRAVWRESTHPDDRARVQAATELALAGRQPYDIEYRIVRPDGVVRAVRTVGNVTWDDAGAPVRWFGTIQDVTPLREAEQALRAIDERYRLIVDHATDAIMLHSTSGELIDVNRQACVNLGYTRDELIGQTHHLFDLHFTRAAGSALLVALEAQDAVQFESEHQRKDGTTFPVEVRMRGFVQNGERISVSSARDISERRRAEEATRQGHTLMRAIVEGSSDAIYVKDLEGRYLLVNGAFAELRGLTVDGLIGTLDPGPDGRGGLGREDQEVLTTGEPRMFEQTLEIDGATRTFHSATFPYWKDGDAPAGLIGVWRETTELKHLEQALRESQKMEAIGRLAGGVAHNFNNLLTVILGYAEVISYGLDQQPEHREPIEQIMAAAERASAVTRQLLSFSRKQALAPRLVHLPTALGELHALLRPLIPADIEMTVHTAVDLGAVLMDAAQFEQAMTNLVVNASDAMPRGGRLRIEAVDLVVTAHAAVHPALVTPGRYVELRVWDSGHGMDEATRARIFEPFFTTKPLGKGTGLGLATVYGFVTQTGGHIDVTSTPGGGTLFRLLLPCSAAPAPAPLLSRTAPAEASGTETILLVEDEGAVRAVARLMLEARGYTVVEARDGEHALDVARGHDGRIDLLLTDLVMPRMNGRDLADVLAGEMPHLQVLFMSGYPDKVVSEDTPADPRFGFLRKPFQPSVMVRRVRDALDRRDS